MGKRIRLLTACHIGGKICEAGEIVMLADGDRGPHKAVHRSHDRIDYGTNPPVDANRILGDIIDVPLFEEIEEEEPHV